MSDESAAEPARYVAIITDGNGRWASARGLPTIEGHRAGADVVKARLRDAVSFGVRELTVYSFSTENWSRPAEEGRVAIRNIRRDVMHDLRELKESGETGADDEKRAETELQKLTDQRIGELDASLKAKEEEILEV